MPVRLRKEDVMPKPDTETLRHRLGAALSRVRERAETTPVELAQAMGEGSSFASRIADWENGRSTPAADQLWRYLDALDLSFTDLDLELDPKARSPRLRKIAADFEAMGRR